MGQAINRRREYGGKQISPYEKEYLTIYSLANNNTISWKLTGSTAKTIYWSIDKTTWNEVTSTTDGAVITSLSSGGKVYLKGENSVYGSSTTEYNSFDSDNAFGVEGNIMSLIYGDSFLGERTINSGQAFRSLFQNTPVIYTENLILPATKLSLSCYNRMFYGCSALITAPELPATTLGQYCYQYMFHGCSSLTTAPELPVTKLQASCYSYMFAYCSNLTTAPTLPATTLASSCYEHMFRGCTKITTVPTQFLHATALSNYCYRYMFYGCTSLTTAPELPATTLTSSCYQYMFYGCSNLNYIKCLATDISASSCTSNWVSGVKSSGTFVKNSTMTSWTTGVNGIPSGWTVQNA